MIRFANSKAYQLISLCVPHDLLYFEKTEQV